MNNIILTNNPKVSDSFKNSIFVNGSYLELLYEVRNYIHKGHSLITYPLNASIRMIFSPFRSIMISKKQGEIIEDSILIIEESILKYISTVGNRNSDYRNVEDYKIMDYELLLSAVAESKRFN